jgi:two-component system response regulator HydG
MANILVIDDNLDICQLLDRFLTKKGHQVQTTISGKTGIDYVKKSHYDLIFCDFKLREMDGREILKKVKEISPDTQVVIITGYGDIKIAVEVIKNGAFDYVTKPLIPDEILLLIERAMAIKRNDHSYSVNFVTPKNLSELNKARNNGSNDTYL